MYHMAGFCRYRCQFQLAESNDRVFGHLWCLFGIAIDKSLTKTYLRDDPDELPKTTFVY